MFWYVFRYWSITVMRVAGIAAVCHFIYLFSKPHFAFVTSLLVAQEIFTWMNIKYQQKRASKFMDSLDELNETLQIENMSKENWN